MCIVILGGFEVMEEFFLLFFFWVDVVVGADAEVVLILLL